MTAPKGNGSAGRAAPGDDITRLHETGVLIIGGGAAAASAAVAAGETGARTTLILKKQLGRSGSTNFPGVGSAWQAADGCSGTDDSPAIHYADIMDAALAWPTPGWHASSPKCPRSACRIWFRGDSS